MTIYSLAMAASLVISLLVALLMWRYRRFPGAWAMMTLAIGAFVWAAAFLAETNSKTLALQILCSNIAYLGLITVAPAWFAFSLKYTGGDRLLPWKQVWVLFIIPVALAILVWTNDWHGLMWRNQHLVQEGPFMVLVRDYGPGFWLLAVHNYLLLVAGAVILASRLFRGTPLYRGQAVALIVGLALPLIWDITGLFGWLDLIDLTKKDLTPVVFSVSGLIIALGLVRYKLFQVVPFAYRFVIRELKDGILLFDVNGHLMEANPAALGMAGVNPDITGRHIDYLRAYSPLFAAVAFNEQNRAEVRIDSRNGTLYYEVETVPMKDNRSNLVGWSASIHDITVHKNDEMQLAEALAKEQELRNSLETEVQKRARYTRALVHELKTPLTPIIATSEIMMAALMEEPWAKMARNINRGGRNLDRKVDELLDLARSEIGMLTIDIAETSPADVVREALREIEPSAEGRRQRLEVEIETPLPNIRADAARLRQVICSLVDNAFKFSRDEGTVVLRARHTEDRLVVEVEDNGPGMTEAEQSRLFQIYERTDDDRRRLSGLGMGLALSKSLVELHGGSIWVRSRKDQGSVFGFEIPSRGPAAASA